jgi:hypothetical protein
VSSYRVGVVSDARMPVKELDLKKGEYQVTDIDKKGRVTLEKDGEKRDIDPQK